MTKQGRVIALDGKKAYIAAVRQSACGENCAHCKGNCAKSDIKFYAENKIGAKIGDEVLVFAESKKIFLPMLCLYILPVILVFVSSYLGSIVFKNDLVTVLFFILSLLLWTIVIKKVNKIKITHSVIKVVGRND